MGNNTSASKEAQISKLSTRLVIAIMGDGDAIPFVEQLKNYGIDFDKPVKNFVNAAEEGGNAACYNYPFLHLAAIHGRIDTVKALISAGAKPNAKDFTDRTALDRAREFRHEKVIEELSKYQPAHEYEKTPTAPPLPGEKTPTAPPLPGEKTPTTPPLPAGGAGASSADRHVKTLYTKEDISQAIEDLLTALEDDGHNDNVAKLIALLYASGVNFNEPSEKFKAERSEGDAYTLPLLYFAAQEGHLAAVKAILAIGVAIDEAESKEGRTPLHLAAHRGHAPVIALLLDKGASVNKKSLNGHTALHMAAHRGHTDAIAALLAGGAPVNEVNPNGHTSLHLAAGMGRDSAAKMLLENDANVNAIDSAGSTPLHLAALQGHVEVVRLLLARGADAHKRNQSGHTPLDCATRHPLVVAVFNTPIDRPSAAEAEDDPLPPVSMLSSVGARSGLTISGVDPGPPAYTRRQTTLQKMIEDIDSTSSSETITTIAGKFLKRLLETLKANIDNANIDSNHCVIIAEIKSFLGSVQYMRYSPLLADLAVILNDCERYLEAFESAPVSIPVGAANAAGGTGSDALAFGGAATRGERHLNLLATAGTR